MHGCENDILYNGVIRGTRIHFIDSEKRLKKRMVTGSILLLFVISIIAVIFVVDISDDSSASYPSASEVYVDDNLHFTESELYYDGVSITNDPTNAVASYDPDTGTLTLNGYNSGGIGSTSDSGLVVKLVGNNAISSGKIVDSNIIGVYAKNDLLFNSESNSSLDITLNGNSQFGIYAEGNMIIDSNITISCKIFSNDIAYGIYSENNITLSNSSKLLIETMGSEQYGCYGKGSLNLNDSVLGIELGAKNNATGDGIFLEKSYSNSGSITFSNSKVSVITGSSSSRFNAITTNGGLDKTAIIDINLTQLSINGGFNCGIRNFSQFGTTNDIQIDSSTITIGSSSYKLITGIQSANNGIFLEDVNLVLYAVKGIDLYTAKSNVKISIIGISTLELTSEMPFLTVRSDNSTLIDLSEGGYVLLNSVNSLGRVDLGSKTTIENISSYETTGDNSNLEYLLSESGLIKFIYGSNTTPASQVELIGTLLIISYISDGRNIFQPKTVEYGKVAEMPNEVIKPGYVFEGWYTNEEFTSLWDHELPITSNLTLYAKWSPIQYAVEFNKTSGTGSMSSINMTYDRAVNLPKNSFEYSGYNFMGWSDKNGGEVKYSDQQSVKNLTETDSQTLTLYAVWSVGKYTLSFNTDGGTSISPIIKEYGESIGAVPDPERSGYVFSGWEPKIPLTMPSDNLTVSAKWSVEKYTISFNTDGGSHIPSITGEYGASVSIPNSPTRTGYDFEGWDRNIPTTIPSENVTLNAIWVPREYTIVFDSDGGSTLPTITLKYGEKIGAVEPPKKSGYSFVGWDRKVPETMPAEDLIITALWAEGIADPLAEGSEVWKEGNLTYIENETVTSGEDGSVTTERILTATDSEGKIVFTLMSTIIKSPGEKAVYVIESRTDSKGTVTTKTAELTANVSEVPFVDENSLFELDLIAGDDTDYEVVINIEGNRFFFTEELLTYLAERECSVQLKSDVFSVSYDKNVVVKLSRGGDTEFLFDAVNPEMTDRQMDAVGDNMAVSIDLLSSEGYIDGLGGISEISMLFDPGAGTDANRLKVFHADVEGNITGKDTDYDHASDMITFYTDHHSVFFIDETEGPKESGVPIIPLVIAVVVILAAVAGGFIYLKGRSVPEESPKMPPKAFRK